MAKTPKLTVLFEKLRGQTFNLEKESISVGRKDGMDIVLKDGSVSGHHADIIRTENENGEVTFLLRDNDSTNGTRVNNTPITEHVLKNSDLITFGNVEVLFDGDTADSNEADDFSHLTNTIDISSLEEKTTAPQTLTNFNPRNVKEARNKARIQKGILLTFILGGAVLLGLAAIVIITLATH